jgi:polyhydroxyalkanoate synthesis regulator phasin
MDKLDLGQLIQQSYYVTLGVSSALLEGLQDEGKREENLRLFTGPIDTLPQKLSEKGVTTEAEARRFVDEFIANQLRGQGSSPIDVEQDEDGNTTVTTTATTIDASNSVNDGGSSRSQAKATAELQELTEQLAALRAELRTLRDNPR